MKKLITLFTLLITTPLMHAAASAPTRVTTLQDDSSKRERTEREDVNAGSKRQRTASGRTIAEIPDTGTYTLISSDLQSIEIPSHTALRQSGFLRSLHDFNIEASCQEGFEIAGTTTDLSTANISAEPLRDVITYMRIAELSEALSPASLDKIKQHFEIADYLQVSFKVIDLIAAHALRQFGNNLAHFADFSPLAKSAIAKQLYLTLPEGSVVPQKWRNGEHNIAFGVSIQDLIDHDKLPPIRHLGDDLMLRLDYKNINDLTGLNRIPGIENVNIIGLTNNKLQTLPVNAFIGLHNLNYMQLCYNELQTIEPGAFSGLTGLETISLTCNQLHTIAQDAFANLPNLEVLNLNFNRIQTIKPGTFKKLSKLGALALEHNQLRTIAPGELTGLSNLYTLNLKTNPIAHAEQERIGAEAKAASPDIRIHFSNQQE